MAKKPVGEMVISLDLETAAYTKAQKKILAESKEAASTINGNFQRLGVTSDQVYTAMASRAEVAFRKIGLSSKASLAEVERAYAAMVTSINTANQQMAKNPLFETLGIRSMAAIEAQKKAVIDSFEAIKTIGFKNNQERINAQRAMNAQLKTLNKEMVGDHEMSMAAMMRAVLRFYAAYYVISTVVGAVGRAMMSGVKAIDDMQLSAVTVAATITNLQGTSGNVVENYKKNLEYAKALVPVLMKIDAASLANLEQVQLINNALAMHGVILDSTNKKQVDSMTALTNTIAIFTKGQNQTQQSIQETNAALNGEVTSRNRLALMLDQQIRRQGDYKDGLKGLNIEAQKHGDWLERIAPYLVGINAATGDISKTWEAVKTSLQTTWMILQTEIFADFYKGLVTSGQELIGWTRENAPKIGVYFGAAMNAVGDAIGAAWGALKGFGPLLKDLSPLISAIAYGWGGVLAVLKPIGEFLGNSITLTYNLLKMIGNATLAIGAFATGNTSVAKTAWNEAKKNFAEVEKLSIANRKLLVDGIADSIVAYDKQYQARKKAESTSYVPKVPPGGKSEEEKKKAADAAKKADEELARFYKESTELRQKAELAGMDGSRKAFEQNRIEAEKSIDAIKEAYNKLTPAQKRSTAATMEANLVNIKAIQTQKDELVVTNMVQKSREDNAKVMAKETAAMQKINDDYEKLMNIVAPVTDRTYEMSKAIEKITLKFEAGTPAWQEAIDLVKAFYDALNQKDKIAGFEKEAEDARKMVTFYNDLNNMESEYRNAKFNWIEKEAALKKAKGADEIAVAKWVAMEKVKLVREEMDAIATKFDYDNKYTKDTIANFGKVLDAAQTMYDKDSSEYKRLAEIKKGVQVAEIAMEVAKNIQVLAGAMSRMAADAAVTTTAVACSTTRAISYAVESTAAAGALPPPAGFVAVAAMAAIMAGVLAIAGIAFGGGSASASISGPAYGQNTTVLGGENGQASESIQKSWELLEDTYDMQYQKLSGIYNEMKDLNDNITGLVVSIIRGGDIGTAFGNVNIGETMGGGSISKPFMAIANIIPIIRIAEIVSKVLGGFSIVNYIGKSLFGSTETTIAAAGIALGKITIDALLDGATISARRYVLIKTEKDGGLFGSDKTSYSTMYKALDESTALLFTKVFKNMGQTLFSLASSLGTDVQKALEYEFAAGKINLQGLNAEKVDKKLTAYFSKIGDKAVEALFGSITKGYQKVGEGLMETAIRLVIDKEVILETLSMTNQAFVAADTEIIKTREVINSEWTRWKKLSKTQRFLQFEGQTPDKYITETYVAGIETAMQKTIAFSEALIEMAGGLDKLQEAAATYYDKFFSDVEKQERLQGQLSSIMSELSSIMSDPNLALPDTRPEYRAIVERLNLNTEAGQRAYITLIGLAEAADTYYSVLEDATDAATKSQNDYIESLKRLSETIAKWLAELNLSSLAPVQSAEGWRSQYTSMLSAATVPGAEAGAVTDYLSYATKYLEFERTYGGNYQAIYDAVVADVLRIQAATLAAIPAHASGGLTSGLSFAGEIGREWVVPTYEPQRSSFLRDVGVDSDAIGRSIAKHLSNEATGGSASGRDIHVHISLDGREIGVAVAKQIPRNSDLSDAIRSVN